MITINATGEEMNVNIYGDKFSVINELTAAIETVNHSINTSCDLGLATTLNNMLRRNVLYALFNVNIPEVKSLLDRFNGFE